MVGTGYPDRQVINAIAVKVCHRQGEAKQITRSQTSWLEHGVRAYREGTDFWKGATSIALPPPRHDRHQPMSDKHRHNNLTIVPRPERARGQKNTREDPINVPHDRAIQSQFVDSREFTRAGHD
jgi:hypothetical protein